jgi:large subunit ribosomal protein L32
LKVWVRSVQELQGYGRTESRKTPSKRGMHRSHDRLKKPALSIDAQTGESHLRHCITPDGFYRGRRVIEKVNADDKA